jgi:hypothetical protein
MCVIDVCLPAILLEFFFFCVFLIHRPVDHPHSGASTRFRRSSVTKRERHFQSGFFGRLYRADFSSGSIAPALPRAGKV